MRRLKEVLNLEISALDGHLGRIHDLLFDDQSWKLRYLVVDTARWLPGRRVLLAPHVAGGIDWSTRCVPVKLTREEVRDSPDVSTDHPVAFQHLAPIHAYYGWPFWEGMDVLAASLSRPRDPPRDPHLRSARELRGYEISETDAEFGHLEDFVFDEIAWQIRFLVIETKRWLQRRMVLVTPEWVSDIDWVTRSIKLELAAEKIRNGPEFDPGRPIDTKAATLLADYYGRRSSFHA